ncbi:hypothetical protein AW736_18580 [Termitidicoccus mucosus]|uniref:TonB-dependent receptor plug domain-containing protein n=1 Tax=Termitidicoccus mucosus TaxID=1184151 RepID=A0A178IEM4_9BACT|nr:hypothetical protein AW736_18580 [Opitutaceae bacterium TSB47]
MCAAQSRAQAVRPAPGDAPESARSGEKDSPVRIQTTLPGDADNEDPVEMSVFEVTAKKRGYYAESTMAGTRLNSSIEDLGAAITVITTEQMDDFGMLDINDIFNFEVGTEGAGTFTDVSIDANGSVSDGNMDSPGTANRVRGLGNPNQTFGNFETSGRTPLDRLLLDGVEITRGPSSIIAGLGNPAGTINSIPATPHLTRNRNKAQVRLDGNNGFRESLDVSRVLVKGRLAVRAQQMFWHQGFQRKPSGTDAELYNFMVKYQPSKRTVFNVAYSKYKISGNRANVITPADGITPWRERGEYTWDPLEPNLSSTFGAAYDRNGNKIPGQANTNYMTNNGGLARMFQTSGRGTSLLFVDRDGSILWMSPRGTETDNAFANDQTLYNYAMVAQQPVLDPNLPVSTTSRYPVGVHDQSLYDWTSINIAATDWFYQTNDTILARLTQTFIETPRQYLAVDLGWFREDSTSYSKMLMGKSKKNQTSSFLGIDINRKLYDGSDNPNYLRPYLAVNQDLVSENPLLNDTFRTQMAYKLDFRRDTGWTRWLGLHQVTAYHEYKQFETRRYNYRHALTDEHPWLPAGTPRGTSNNQEVINPDLPWNQISNTNTRNYAFYYMGDAIGQNVDYSPGTLTPGQYDYIWGNVATGLIHHEPAYLGLAADLAGSGGTNNSLKITKGMGAVLQSHLVRDGVVVTAGVRRDRVFQKDGVSPQLLPDGLTHDFAWDNRWVDKWRLNSGTTHAEGVVVKPAAWIDANAPWYLRWMRQVSVFYNQSDSLDLNYDPAINLAGQDIPNPTGTGKDYGFTLRLFNNRLIMKLNRYENRTQNQRGTAAPVGRVLLFDIYEVDYEDEDLPDDQTANRTFSLNKIASDWVKQQALAAGETLTPTEIFNRVAAIMQMTPERLRTLQLYRTRVTEVDEGLAKGYEFEMNWAPTDYLNLRFNASKAEARNITVAPGFAAYLEERLEFWQNLIDPLTGARWWTSAYVNEATGLPGQTAERWFNDSVKPDWDLAKQREGIPRDNVSEYTVKFLANMRLSGITNHPILKAVDVGGSIRWQSKIGIGNYGIDLDGPDPVTGQIVHTKLDPTRPVWGESTTIVDFNVGYRTKLWRNRVAARFQFAIANAFEDGRLQAVRADSNGKPYVWRIIDPRQFNFIATFEF